MPVSSRMSESGAVLAAVKGKSLRDGLRPPLDRRSAQRPSKIRSGRGDVAGPIEQGDAAHNTLDSNRPIQVHRRIADVAERGSGRYLCGGERAFPGDHQQRRMTTICLCTGRRSGGRNDGNDGISQAVACFPQVRPPPQCATACQHLVDGADAPASVVASADARLVEMLGDRLDAHEGGGKVLGFLALAHAQNCTNHRHANTSALFRFSMLALRKPSK